MVRYLVHYLLGLIHGNCILSIIFGSPTLLEDVQNLSSHLPWKGILLRRGSFNHGLLQTLLKLLPFLHETLKYLDLGHNLLLEECIDRGLVDRLSLVPHRWLCLQGFIFHSIVTSVLHFSTVGESFMFIRRWLGRAGSSFLFLFGYAPPAAESVMCQYVVAWGCAMILWFVIESLPTDDIGIPMNLSKNQNLLDLVT